MAEVEVSGEVAAEAGEVWRLVRDFGGIAAWMPGLESCELEGSGVGAVRTVRMGPVEIRERLEELDEVARRLRYSIVEAPVPAREYLATVVVEELPGGRTRVVWGSRFEPAAGASEADLEALFRGVYEGGIAGLRSALAG